MSTLVDNLANRGAKAEAKTQRNTLGHVETGALIDTLTDQTSYCRGRFRKVVTNLSNCMPRGFLTRWVTLYQRRMTRHSAKNFFDMEAKALVDTLTNPLTETEEETLVDTLVSA